MRILLCCGEQGLLEYSRSWRRLPCPVERPSLLAVEDGCVAVANGLGQLWAMGRMTSIDRGAETLLLGPDCALVLSGETDCLSLLSLRTGQLLLTAPVGIYPQEMCLISRNLVAVCGGAEGTVRLMDPWVLRTLHTLQLPGSTERVAFSGGALYVLCAICDDVLCSFLFRIQSGGSVRLAVLPGLPGAVCSDGHGGVWAASSETLVHLDARGRVLRRVDNTGLVRTLMCAGGCLLMSDPLLGACTLLGPGGQVLTKYEGDVGQAVLLRG